MKVRCAGELPAWRCSTKMPTHPFPPRKGPFYQPGTSFSSGWIKIASISRSELRLAIFLRLTEPASRHRDTGTATQTPLERVHCLSQNSRVSTPVFLSIARTQELPTVSTIEIAERLKKELTDKWVVVAANAPELKRFANLTGKVKTVNMNCRALVEFDGPVDIGWYDIDTTYLKVVDAPKPKKAEAHAEAKPAATAAPAAKPAATGGGSPLDKIRAAGAKPADAPAPAAGGGSPLDKIRAAGAKPALASAPVPAAGGSPLDKIRAAGAKPAAAPAPEVTASSPEEAPAPAAAPKPAAPATGSPLDRIRAAGAAKKD